MESLEMNNVQHAYLDGKEIYKIYDGSSISTKRLIWSKVSTTASTASEVHE